MNPRRTQGTPSAWTVPPDTGWTPLWGAEGGEGIPRLTCRLYPVPFPAACLLYPSLPPGACPLLPVISEGNAVAFFRLAPVLSRRQPP